MIHMIAERIRAQQQQSFHDAKAPRRGDPAPDFELRDVNGENPVRLSGFHGMKPVAQIFGSYT